MGLATAVPSPSTATALAPGARPWLPLSPPHQTGQELDRLRDMLGSGWIAPGGPIADAFEAALGQATGFPAVLATASGTAALHLGYRVLGLQPGDEVWTSTLTFIASIAPAVQMGARPRFIDVAADSWTMDPALLERELARAARRRRLPRVVVPVDLYGQCADLATIVALCDRWGVAVMADSAQALGASQHGRHAGQGARLAVISFNGNKIITGGSGGALLAQDLALVAAARHLASQGRDPGPHYRHSAIGHAYVMPAPVAALALAQLPALPQRVAARRAIFARYCAGLGALPGISPMPEAPWGRSSRWLSALCIDARRFGAGRDAVIAALAAQGMEARPLLLPLHRQPVFRGAARAGGTMAEWLFLQGLCLPSGTAMTAPQQARVIAAVVACQRG